MLSDAEKGNNLMLTRHPSGNTDVILWELIEIDVLFYVHH